MAIPLKIATTTPRFSLPSELKYKKENITRKIEKGKTKELSGIFSIGLSKFLPSFESKKVAMKIPSKVSKIGRGDAKTDAPV